MTQTTNTVSDTIRNRRSVRDFSPRDIPEDVLRDVLDDARWAPSWSNTQPYRIAVASGALKDHLKHELCNLFDNAQRAVAQGIAGKLKLMLNGGLPDGDFKVNLRYPEDLLPARRACGFGLYGTLGIARDDMAARTAQMRRNFEFFGAPTVMFLFVHQGLHEFSILDAGVFLQTLMLSAQSRGLATCAQGALATWASPVKAAFDVPGDYKLICGVAIGYASEHAVNRYNPGRADIDTLLLKTRSQPA